MIYKTADRRAKWCTLIERYVQAKYIRRMLENMSPKETRYMRKEELEAAKRQITLLDNYFTKAIEESHKKAQNNPEEKAAMEYAKKDSICNDINFFSREIYAEKK